MLGVLEPTAGSAEARQMELAFKWTGKNKMGPLMSNLLLEKGEKVVRREHLEEHLNSPELLSAGILQHPR